MDFLYRLQVITASHLLNFAIDEILCLEGQ